MYKKMTTALALGLALASAPAVALAQQEVPTGTSVPVQRKDSVGQTTSTTDTQDDGFNWSWLIPLLAIPLLFWFLIDRANKDSDRPMYRNQRMAGTKGGQARYDQDQEEEI